MLLVALLFIETTAISSVRNTDIGEASDDGCCAYIKRHATDMAKIIMLAGAPQLASIQENALTVNQWLPPFARFLRPPSADDIYDGLPRPLESPGTAFLPEWRTVSLEAEHLPTGWSQRGWLLETFSPVKGEPAQAHRRTQADLHDDNDLLTQFVEHSYSLYEQEFAASPQPRNVHTPIPRSHIGKDRRRSTMSSLASLYDGNDDDNDADDTIATSAFLSASPTATTTFDFIGFSPAGVDYHQNAPAPPSRNRISAPYLTNLSSLPTAGHLISLQPQTVTRDFVVGFISLAAPRTVTVRKTGQDAVLIEMVVGDETRAGFGTSFWVNPDDRTSNNIPGLTDTNDNMEHAQNNLQLLRVGDIILLRNVELSSFRKVVYGQSLRRRTSVLLLRRPGSSKGILAKSRAPLQSIDKQVLDKAERVSEWAKRFIRPPIEHRGIDGSVKTEQGVKRKRMEAPEASLPPEYTPD